MKKHLIAMLIPALFPMMAVGEGGGKRVVVCEKSFEESDDGALTGRVDFTFSDGHVESLNVFDDLPAEIQRRLTVHGLLQKGGDSYAGVKGNVAEAKANLAAILEQLKSGAWKGERGDAGPRLGELAEAIARIKSVPVEKAREAVEKATDEQRKDWRSNAKVKSVIATLRAEAAAKALEAAGEQELTVDIA